MRIRGALVGPVENNITDLTIRVLLGAKKVL